MSQRFFDRKGASTAIFGLGFTTSIAVMGMALDGGMMYQTRKQAQLAADAGALAAAVNVCKSNYTSGAKAVITLGQGGLALANGVVTRTGTLGGSSATLPVHEYEGKRLANINGPKVADVSVVTPIDGDRTKVRVNTAITYNFLFLQLLGFRSTKIVATALAQVRNKQDDSFQAVAFGKHEVNIKGLNVVDRYDHRDGLYETQATNTDSVTGLKFSKKGADVKSNCLVQVKGKNVVAGGIFVSDTGNDINTQRDRFALRTTGKKAFGDTVLRDWGGHGTNEHDGTTTTHEYGSYQDHEGHWKTGWHTVTKNAYMEDYHDDLDLSGHQCKSDGDRTDRDKTRCVNRGTKSYGDEYTGEDDKDEMEKLALQIEDEGHDCKTRAARVSGTESSHETNHGQRMIDCGTSLRSIATSLASESVVCNRTPKFTITKSQKDHDYDAAHSHWFRPWIPGVRTPTVNHCGLIEVKGNKNHVTGNLHSAGPIVLKGSPTIDGQVAPYNDVPEFTMPTYDMTGPRTTNNNSLLSGLSQWNSSLLRFRANGKDDVTIPAGTYYMKTFEAYGHATVRISPGTKLYVSRFFRVHGHADVNPDGDPKGFLVFLGKVSGHSINHEPEAVIRGHATVAGGIVNKDGDIEVKGLTEVFGSLMSGETLEIQGMNGVHLDMNLGTDMAGCPQNGRLIQ